MRNEKKERTAETSTIRRKEESFEVHHTEDTRHTSDGTQTHNDADTDLGSAVNVAIDKDGNRNQHKRPICNDVDDTIKVASSQDESSRQTFLRSNEGVSDL